MADFFFKNIPAGARYTQIKVAKGEFWEKYSQSNLVQKEKR